MLNSFVIEESSRGVLASKFVLLDTNFIIDAALFRKESADLLQKFRDLNCTLVTTRTVILEFLGGTTQEEKMNEKIDFLEKMFGTELTKIIQLPTESKFPNTNDILKFNRQCNKFSYADLELFLALKKYKRSDLLLVTRNHVDFTSKLFNRMGFITLLGNKEIRTFGLYKAL